MWWCTNITYCTLSAGHGTGMINLKKLQFFRLIFWNLVYGTGAGTVPMFSLLTLILSWCSCSWLSVPGLASRGRWDTQMWWSTFWPASSAWNIQHTVNNKKIPLCFHASQYCSGKFSVFLRVDGAAMSFLVWAEFLSGSGSCPFPYSCSYSYFKRCYFYQNLWKS